MSRIREPLGGWEIGPGAKRCRGEAEAGGRVEFCLRFSQPQTPGNMFSMIKDTLPHIDVQVVKRPAGSAGDGGDGDDFEGIVIENIDEKRVCIVHARLACEVEAAPDAGDMRFSVSLETLSVLMRNVSSHYTMELVKYAGADDLELVSRDQITNAKVNSSRINTLCKEFAKDGMKQMQYQFTVQIELATFRSIVKTAKDLHARNLRFTVFERRAGSRRNILFCLSSKGDAENKHYFSSAVNDQGVICTVDDGEQGEEPDAFSEEDRKYDGSFSIAYLNTFLKSMDRQQLTLRLCPELVGSQHKPLIVLYPLGPDKSYVCFVLAPKIDDDE